MFETITEQKKNRIIYFIGVEKQKYPFRSVLRRIYNKKRKEDKIFLKILLNFTLRFYKR